MPSPKDDTQIQKIEALMKDHVSDTNFKWNSNVFTSSSIAKIILKAFRAPKTQFRIFHKTVRDILKKWEKLSYCEHIETTHYAHCKKTKMIIQFNNYGFSNLVPEVFPLPI
ncbi:MAG: hypothetical protein HWN66_10465 [Candidatus Helarchaeota archaeon]|nr:hypothetical protein [Candidatus Helarchaeota archaeon]